MIAGISVAIALLTALVIGLLVLGVGLAYFRLSLYTTYA